MKEIILQKSNFRCENIYICRPLRRLRRLAVEYVKNTVGNLNKIDIDENIVIFVHILSSLNEKITFIAKITIVIIMVLI